MEANSNTHAHALTIAARSKSMQTTPGMSTKYSIYLMILGGAATGLFGCGGSPREDKSPKVQSTKGGAAQLGSGGNSATSGGTGGMKAVGGGGSSNSGGSGNNDASG